MAPLRCRSRASVELAYNSLTSAFSPPTPKEAGISPPRKALNLTGIKTRRWPSVKSDERTQKHDPSHVVSAIARSRNEARNWKDQLAKVRALQLVLPNKQTPSQHIKPCSCDNLLSIFRWRNAHSQPKREPQRRWLWSARHALLSRLEKSN